MNRDETRKAIKMLKSRLEEHKATPFSLDEKAETIEQKLGQALSFLQEFEKNLGLGPTLRDRQNFVWYLGALFSASIITADEGLEMAIKTLGQPV